MSSGHKVMQFNTRERALSDDHNRLQRFAAADMNQALRRMFDDSWPALYALPGYSVEGSVVASPLRAMVLGGLMVQPDLPTSLLVSPGSLMAVFPDAFPNADDSPYVFVDDPGVQLAGTLNFTANPGAGVRIDVVECQPIDTVLEVDNRDVFDPATGAFAPAPVTKVRAHRLTYRIRLGTPGGGYPGSVTGWLPLAVASVPVAATDFSGVTFWDVRPLYADRWNGGALIALDSYTPFPRAHLKADDSTGGQLRVQGVVDTVFGAYRAGGRLYKGSPTATMGAGDLSYVDIRSTENQSAGLSYGANQIWNLALLFPHGLPRWVRYSETPVVGARVPNGCRGIPAVYIGTGAHSGGILATGILPPAATGLTTLAVGVHVASGVTDGSSVPQAMITDGVACYSRFGIALAPAASGSDVLGMYDVFTLVPGTTVPTGAKAVRLLVVTTLNGGIGAAVTAQQQAFALGSATPGDILGMTAGTAVAGVGDGAGNYLATFYARVPLDVRFPAVSLANSSFRINTTAITGGFTRTACAATLIGWEFGP